MKQSLNKIFRRLALGLCETTIVIGFLAFWGSAWCALTFFPWALTAGILGAGIAGRMWLKLPKTARIKKIFFVTGLVLLIVCIASIGVLCMQHRFRSQGRLTSFYSEGHGSIFNVIPEADIASAGIKVSGLLRIFPTDQMHEVRARLRTEYARMSTADGFQGVGNVSVMTLLQSNTRHAFVYYPKTERGPKGALLFLHGAGGPLVLYPWLWSELAEREGLIVICPSWDNGEWSRPEATQFALECLHTIMEANTVSSERIYLAGHSQGAVAGLGVLELEPELFRGFVCISGYGSSANKYEMPTFVIEGGKDEGISMDSLSETLEANSRLLVLPEDDHFIMLRSMPVLTEAVSEWMGDLENKNSSHH